MQQKPKDFSVLSVKLFVVFFIMNSDVVTNKLCRGDCKYIMDTLIKEGVQVDLIYLDPPFNSSRIYNMIFNGGNVSAQQKAFHDMWDFTARAKQLRFDFREMVNDLEDIPESFKEFIKVWVDVLGGGNAEDQKLLNYLMYMTERLILMKKVLKRDGSIFFHCDPNASHYLKIIMDGLFDRSNFVNEIVWCYSNSGRSRKYFAKKHDIILWYFKGKKYTWTNYTIPVTEKYLNSHYRQKDENQRQCRIRTDHGRTRIYYPEDGMTCTDWWADIPSLNSQDRKRRYPTQKPELLLNRIITACSEENSLILDPFCGCGTTIESAIRLKRRWIGIDISGDAVDEIEDRIKDGIKESHLAEWKQFEKVESNPETMHEYQRLTPYEKQDWLIRKVGGFPNVSQSGDQGVDGEISIHLGNVNGENKFGRMVFSVKTGKQANPAMIRELKGTMQQEKAIMGGLILDREPTPQMEIRAMDAGKLEYALELDGRVAKQEDGRVAKQEYDKIQILTSSEIVDGKKFMHPPKLSDIKREKRHKGDLI